MRSLGLFTLALVCGSALHAGEAAENWPQWRGPNLNGTSVAARGLPTEWTETKNVVWRVELPSWSAATPIVWDDVVFITSAEEGFAAHKAGGGVGSRRKDKLFFMAINRKDGSVLWRRELGAGNRIGNKQNMTSPSPATDGKHVWTMTGTGLLASWNFAGEKVWQRSLQADLGKFGLQFGYGSSPVLDDGKLYIQVLHGFLTDEPSYLAALDAATGKTLWRIERPTDALHETPDSYSTPTFIGSGANKQLVVAGGGYLTGHDLATGRELWRAGGLNPNNATNYRTIASALVVGDLILTPSRRRPFIAFRPGGERVWSTAYGPDVPTPTSDGERLYIIDDKGIALCLRVADGTTVWDRSRMEPGTYSSSPLLADGKIYATSEDGSTTVLAAGDEFKILAVNKLDDYTLASPAVAGNQIFLRTAKYLYCIAESGETTD